VTGLRAGAHALLERAGFYDLSQRLLRSKTAPTDLVDGLLRPSPEARILDLGCGTARILDSLPPTVDYLGCDAEPAYVEAAKRRHGDRARFRHLDVERLSELGERGFDLILAKGLLHHLDDRVAANLYAAARPLLREGGTLVTLDPLRVPGQGLANRTLLALDRGRHIRAEADYLALLGSGWEIRERRVLDGRLRFPYRHFFLRVAPAY
jgi:SAM-dependent methyltransferase